MKKSLVDPDYVKNAPPTEVEVTEDDFIRMDWDEQLEERERILKEQEEGSLRNLDGSLNTPAIYRKFNRAGRRK